MAKLYLSEYSDVGAAGINRLGAIAAGQEPSTVEQTPLAIGTETKSAAFDPATRFIRVHVDAICSINIAANPGVAATTNSKRLAANTTEYFGVKPGHILSVISNT